MAGLKTASGEEIDGSFELRVEVEEGRELGRGDLGRGDLGRGDLGRGDAGLGDLGQGQPRLLTLCVTGELRVGGLVRRIQESLGQPRLWSDHALWWEQRRLWLQSPSPTLDSLGVGGGSRLLFTPRHRPLRLLLPHGGVLRLRLDFAGTPGRAAAAACGLLGIPHPEELSLLWPERGEGSKKAPPPPDLDLTHLRLPTGDAPPPALPPELLRPLWSPKHETPPGPPRSPPGTPLERRAGLHGRWLDVAQSLLAQGVAEDQELLLRFKYPWARDEEPQGLYLALLQQDALRSVLAEELEVTEDQGLLLAALQFQIEGAEWGDGGDPQDPPEPPDLDTALERLEMSLGGGTPAAAEELGAPPELEEELELHSPSPWPFRGSRPTRALLSGSSLSLWTPPGSGSPRRLNLSGSEVTPELDLGAQKFGIKIRVPTPGGTSETLLRCRDPPQFSRWLCLCHAAAIGGGGCTSPPPALRAQIRGVLEVLGVKPPGTPPGTPPETPPGTPPETPPGTPARPPPDPRRLLPPRLQGRLGGKQFPQRLLRVLLREGPLSPPQARLRFLRLWRALPGAGTGTFLVRFRGAPRAEVLALGPSQLLRIDLGSGAVTRSWDYGELRQWDVNWDSQEVRLWLGGDVTLGLRVLSAPPRLLHQFLGGRLALRGPPRDPQELQRLMEGGYDPQ